LSSVTDGSLSVWLLHNYVRECAQRCPGHVSYLTTDLHYTLSSIVDYRVSDAMEMSVVNSAGLMILCETVIWKTDVKHRPPYAQFIEELRSADTRLVDFCIALICLHFTKLMCRRQNNFYILEVIHKLLKCEDPGVDSMTRSKSKSSHLLFTMGADLLMKLKIETSSDSMLLVEMSKAFFTESIITSNHDQQHVQCLARINLASLYYRTEQYRSAIDQCLLAMKPCQARCSSHVVDMQHLSQSDDDISVVSGLIALYQFIIQTRSTNQSQQTRHIGVVVAESYSFFLTMKCLIRLKQVDSKLMKTILRCYRDSLGSQQSQFIGDILLALWSEIKTKCTYKIAIYIRRSLCRNAKAQPRVNTVRLRCSLMKSAVERLIRVHQAMSHDYIAVTTIVTTDYEAMYAYKCGEYEKCLQLCEQNVNKLQFVPKLTYVCMVPSSDLLVLMDDDLLSIIGVTVELLEPVKIDYSNLVSQLTLSLYLLVHCKLRLRHSMTSLAAVLHLVLFHYRRYPNEHIIDRLILSFVYRKARCTLQRYTTRRNQLQ